MKVLRRFSVGGRVSGGRGAKGSERSEADLHCGEDGMGLADNANDDRTLLDGFLGIFDLEDTALRRAGERRV